MSINHPIDACIICLQPSESDLTSIHSYISVNDPILKHDEDSNILDSNDEQQIALLLHNLSGNDFVSINCQHF